MKRLLLITLTASLLHAQSPDGVPAASGLSRLEEKFGRDAVDRVFELTGVAGDPQPLEWRVTTHEPGAPHLLHEFWLDRRRATDEGVNDDFYPDRIPKGFFSLARLKVDSTQAFTIVEQIARDAGVGFDAINYKAHCREYSDEPVWTLTLLDKEQEIVGSVHLSGESGTVFRTVWMRRRPNGRLIVEDTALTEPNATTATGKPKPTIAPERTEPEVPPPAPDEPMPERPKDAPDTTPAPPKKVTPPADGEQDVPEIEKLNDLQEKVLPPKQ